MENKIFYVSVKYGEFDFGVSSIIKKLSQTQYDELRAMLGYCHWCNGKYETK